MKGGIYQKIYKGRNITNNMDYENKPAPESIEVEVLEVLPQEGAVVIQGKNGISGKYSIIEPANISFAKPGPANVKFTGEYISYLRNISQSSVNKPVDKGSYYKKPYKSNSYTQPAYRPSYQLATTYKQAEPMVQPYQATRKMVVFVENVTGKQIEEVYNKLTPAVIIKESTIEHRADVTSEMIDGEEVIHMLYDAFIYIDIPNAVSFNSIEKVIEDIKSKKEEDKELL